MKKTIKFLKIILIVGTLWSLVIACNFEDKNKKFSKIWDSKTMNFIYTTEKELNEVLNENFKKGDDIVLETRLENPKLYRKEFEEAIEKGINDERLSFFHEIKSENPNSYRKEFEEAIEKGVVVLGMTPFEAKLAGGAFYYKVQADPTVWKEHANPMQVMWAQSNNPDNSKIEMTFQNETQNKGVLTKFQVSFNKGRVAQINNISCE